MSFNVLGSNPSYKALLPWTIGPKDIEIANKRREIFSDESIDIYFQTNATTAVDDEITTISKDRLINVLNKIAETEAGFNILKALKSTLGNPPDNKKIVFNVEDTYNFDSDSAINSDNNRLIVGVSKCFLNSECNSERYIFDEGKFVLKSFDSNADSETYFIAHEFAHVVSFLNSGITDYETWENVRKKRPIGWVEFFRETDEMFNVYKELLLMGYTPLEICDGFKFLFETTEEARNVLGLIRCTIDEKTEYIGEGKLYQESYGSGIVTYLDNLEKISDLEKNILIQIQNKLKGLSLLPITERKKSKNVFYVLGSQFAGFDLVNAPRENSVIEAIQKAIPNLRNRDFSNIQNSIEEVTDNYVLQPTSNISREMVRQQTEIDHLQDIAKLADRDIVLIQADDKNPQNYTFKFFDANGFNTDLQDKNLKSVFEKNPNTAFIYYNGVNHFQALVPQQPAQQV